MKLSASSVRFSVGDTNLRTCRLTCRSTISPTDMCKQCTPPSSKGSLTFTVVFVQENAIVNHKIITFLELICIQRGYYIDCNQKLKKKVNLTLRTRILLKCTLYVPISLRRGHIHNWPFLPCKIIGVARAPCPPPVPKPLLSNKRDHQWSFLLLKGRHSTKSFRTPTPSRSAESHKSIICCPPRWRRGSGLDFGSDDPGSSPGLPSPRVGPLMTRTSSDVPVPVSG